MSTDWWTRVQEVRHHFSHFVLAVFPCGSPSSQRESGAEEMSLEEGKEWIYCIDRRIALLCVLNVCNHVFGSVAGFAELIHWWGRWPFPWCRTGLNSNPVFGNQCLYLLYVHIASCYLLLFYSHRGPASSPLPHLLPLTTSTLDRQLSMPGTYSSCRCKIGGSVSSSKNTANTSSWFTFIYRNANNMQVQVHTSLPYIYILSIDSVLLPVWRRFWWVTLPSALTETQHQCKFHRKAQWPLTN